MPVLKYLQSTCVSLLMLIFFLSRVQAQQTASGYQIKIDSVQTLLKQQLKEDSTKVKQLNNLARYCFFDMQFRRGLIATVEARKLAQKLHYLKGEGLYYRTLSYFNNFNSLGSYYHFLANWTHSDRKQREETVQLGVSVPNNQTNPKAKIELEEAITYFEKNRDWEVLANLHNAYGLLFQIDQQTSYLKKASGLFKENNQTVPSCFILTDWMVRLERSNRQKEAKEVEIEARTLMANTKNTREKVLMKYGLSEAYSRMDRMSLSFELLHQVEQELEQMGEKELRINALSVLASYCFELSLYKKAIEYFKKAAALCELNLNNSATRLTFNYHQIAFSFIRLKEFEQAKLYIEKARNAPTQNQTENTKKFNTARHYDAMGQLLMGQEKYHEALKNFAQAHDHASQTVEARWLTSYMNYYSAQCYWKLGQLQESIRFGKLSYDKVAPSLSTSANSRTVTGKVSLLLAEVYEEAGQPLESHTYLKVYQKLQKEIDLKEVSNNLLNAEIRSVIEKDELEQNRLKQEKLLQDQRILAIENQREIDGLKAQAEKQLLQSKAEQAELDKKLEKQQLEAKALENKRQQDYQISLLNLDIDNQRKVRTALLGGLALFALFAVVLFRQNRIKQRFNQTLAKQKEEIDHQRDKAEKALIRLQSTQTQLIQKEKLASLGELTAGIAHEIQNPLNFVNNFSEVSAELVKEMEEEREKGKQRDEELEAELLGDLKQNLQKIHHHGGRAAAIVKGMLEHSRISTGERVPTDLNKLADEYLRLSYHGMKAKDNNGSATRFQADYELIADSNLPFVNIVPQEIGRVLLNLLNNAFYAVRNVESPKVMISTSLTDQQVTIKVQDNGTGIPDAIKAKIFQPFFTTKPTGEGTGLGLSLSYDIVTKGHGGTLTVESTEGLGSEFIITLPIV